MPLFADPDIQAERRDDGSILLRSRHQLSDYPRSVAHTFFERAAQHPERVLIAEREGDGFAETTWGQARDRVQALAQGLLDEGLAGKPIVALSGNSVNHLLLMLAAHTVGSPFSPISVAYSQLATDHVRLRQVAGTVKPALIYVEDHEPFAAAAAAVQEVAAGARVVSRNGGDSTLDDLARAPKDGEVAAALDTVGPETVAKYLFTSGSTGNPKGVITTHRMLSANQQMILQVWPWLEETPPVCLDWLPWSHTFGGSHNVNMMLVNGGSMYINDGRPIVNVERAVENIRLVEPTVHFGVPVGYGVLVPVFQQDPELSRHFFAKLRAVFFAAAALPQTSWDALKDLVRTYADHPVAVTTSWGTTEMSPCSTSAHFESQRSDCIGVPVPGCEVKLAPEQSKLEIRIRGPHVTPGYLDLPEATSAAFDDEGFYRTGDAAALIDESDPNKGIRFAGRLAEDFKLDTGTWVHVGAVRTAVLAGTQGLVQDCVICGHNRSHLTAMAWLNPNVVPSVTDAGDPTRDGRLHAHLRGLLDAMNAGHGSSQRIERVLLLETPPDLGIGEITDKGYINQGRCLETRAGDVEALYADQVGTHPAGDRMVETAPRA